MLFGAGLRQRATVARRTGSPALPADQVNATSWRRLLVQATRLWRMANGRIRSVRAGGGRRGGGGRPGPGEPHRRPGHGVRPDRRRLSGGLAAGDRGRARLRRGLAAGRLRQLDQGATGAPQAAQRSAAGPGGPVVVPEPDHARLLDAFFGPEEPSRQLAGRPGQPTQGRRPREPSGRPPRLGHSPADPAPHRAALQARSAHVREDGWEGRAEHDQRWVTGELVQHPPEPLYEQAGRAAGLGQDWDLPVAASQGRRR